MRIPTNSEKGFTLIELLATLLIASIVSGIIYSVFISGMKLYNKIQIEGQMRDDADYIVTMILNEMYENDPKTVEETANGFRMIRSSEMEVEEYLIEETNPEATIEISLAKIDDQKTFVIQTTESPETLNNKQFEEKISTPSSIIGDLSEIKLVCPNDSNKCSNGRIEISLHLHPIDEIDKTLEFNSSFGF